MSSSNFCFRYFHFSDLESTNIHARAILNARNAKEGDVFYCDYQSKGKGQRGEGWQSDWGKNLLFSLILMPELEVENQVYLNMAISVAIWKALDSLSVENVAIKWPNDILVERKKIAGVLIENSLSASLIKNSIVGVGLNVNQIEFSEFKRQATSLSKELGEAIDLQMVLERVLEHIKTEYLKLKNGRFQEIKEAYLGKLYGYKKQMQFEDKDGSFSAQIIDVDEDGRLLILKEEGSVKAYSLKEVAFKA